MMQGGVITPQNWGGAQKGSPTVIVEDGPGTGTGGGGGGGGGPAYDPVAAARAAANAAAKAQSNKENDATRAAVQHQLDLLQGFADQYNTKVGNVNSQYTAGDKLLLESYLKALGGLEGNKTQNEMAEGDSSFSAIVNAIREVASLADQSASVGAGESDRLRVQMQGLRNYTANKSEVNRAFHDTLQSINNSITGLNTDTATNRSNLWNQKEADLEAARANYNNQQAQAWTEILNAENANTNVDSESSEGYDRVHSAADASNKAKAAIGNGYDRKEAKGLNKWEGQGKAEGRDLTSSNRAASINLGGAQKRPEGATLRRWDQAAA
jgi:hypothetical protein